MYGSTCFGRPHAHHQELKQLFLQRLVFVTPLLLSAAIVVELEPVWVCCGWRTHIYMDTYWNILTMHVPMNVKSPKNTRKWQMGFNSALKRLTRLHTVQFICHFKRLTASFSDTMHPSFTAYRYVKLSYITLAPLHYSRFTSLFTPTRFCLVLTF
jgi:hypothetical protein